MTKLKPFTFKLDPKLVKEARRKGISLSQVFRDKLIAVNGITPVCAMCKQILPFSGKRKGR